MTVQELMAALSKIDPASEVWVSGCEPDIIIRINNDSVEVNLEPEGWE